MKRSQVKAKELKEVSGIWNDLTAKTTWGEFELRPGEADVQSSRGSNGKGCQTGVNFNGSHKRGWNYRRGVK